MPAVIPPPPNKSDDFRVLITGFGVFGPFKENPSWLAVRMLHNLVLDPSNSADTATPGPRSSRRIHITSLYVPTVYKDVLSIIPRVHNRPPVLPSSVTDARPPPEDGYDFILHVGVAPPDLMRLESGAHKLGYKKPDNNGELAPVVEDSGRFDNTKESAEEKAEGERLKDHIQKLNNNFKLPGGDSVRGFGKGYEQFDEELVSDLRAEEFVEELKSRGHKEVRVSNDAGRYLCDFIYYCSLAEQRRTNTELNGKGKSSRVLFFHCPPVDQPLSTPQVADYIKWLVMLVCEKIDKGE